MNQTGEEWYRWDGSDLILSLRVQPRARKDEFLAPEGGHYKVRIKAAPVDGKANEHLVKFLSKSFGVRRSAITLLSGKTARSKLFRIESPAKIPLDLDKPEE